MMKPKVVKIKLSSGYASGVFKVEKVINTVEFLPGMTLTKEAVSDLIHKRRGFDVEIQERK